MSALLESKFVIAILASILGLLSAISVQLIVSRIATSREHRKHRLENLGIISAFRAEIRVYKRQLEANFKACQTYKENPSTLGKILAGSTFFDSKVYDAYIGSVGQLGPVYSEQIVRFYSSIEAVKHTISKLEYYIDDGNKSSFRVTQKIEQQIQKSISRAKILDAILSASIVKGLLTEKQQLEIESKALTEASR